MSPSAYVNAMYRILPFLLLCLPISVNAQQLPNWELDSICVCAIDRIWDWVTVAPYNVANDTANPIYPNMRYGPSDWDVHFAMGPVWLNYGEPDTNRLTSIRIHTDPDIVFPDGSPYIPYFSSGNMLVTDSAGFTDHAQMGSPFAFRPDSLRGFYKFEDSLSAVDDFGHVEVLLRKWNPVTEESDTIGTASSNTLLGPTSDWSVFSLPINYQSADLPDTAVVVFYGAKQAAAPTTLWLDDIEFVYNTTSIGEMTVPGISLYPNPVSELLSIESDRQIREITVFSLHGQLLTRISTSGPVDLSEVKAGIYLVQVVDETGRMYTGRISKE